MSDYTIIENLSEEEILNLYDDVILISATQYDCKCVCNDDSAGYYTCYDGADRCENNVTFYSEGGFCEYTFCSEHGGMKFIIYNPNGLECCYSGDASCWRYGGRVINWI